SRRARSADRTPHPASSMNARLFVPVRSFSAPINVGPTNPPMLAIVTTSAIPAAAGAPVRNFVGIEKKGPYAEQGPIGISASDKIARIGLEKTAQPTNPAPVINTAAATCTGRSSLRSE